MSTLLLLTVFVAHQPAARAGEGDAYVDARIWDTALHPSFFPERDDPTVRLGRVADAGRTFGIAFSGGGTRTAAAMLGQLRALDDLGWLERAHYVSTVSGGSWALVPFVFLPEEYCRRVAPLDCDAAFLGDYVAPEALDDAALREPSRFGLARDLYESSIVLRYLERLFVRGDETFSSSIGRNFLARYGLNDQRWFTQRESFDDVVESSGRSREEFYVTAGGRPFLIVSATLLARRRAAAWHDKFLLEVTPLYAGVRVRHDEVRDDEGRARAVGGGYVEAFGYDSAPPCAPGGAACVPLAHGTPARVRVGAARYRFSLRDVVGVSGAAPAEVTASLGYDAFGLPEFKYWPIAQGRRVDEHHEYRHGDGGHIDNTGLLPLLMRQVDDILVLKNSKVPFCTEAMAGAGVERCPPGQPAYEMRDEQLKRFFESRMDPQALTDRFAVFDRQLLERMQDEFKKRKLACDRDHRSAACKPLLFCAPHPVRSNARYGVSPVKNGKPYVPNVCWLYLDRDEAWIEAVRDGAPRRGGAGDAVGDLLRAEGPFRRFPHFRTFLENTWPVPRSIRLKRVQVNALRHLSAWTLKRSAAEIGRALNIP